MNFDFLPFGAQYYRAPTPDLQYWEEDFIKIKKTGFNILKFWVQWSWNNPSPGVYDFDDIKYLLELADKHGLKVVLNLILDSAPMWIYEKYPDNLMETANGNKLYPRELLYRQAGGAPGPCFHHEKTKIYKREFVTEAARQLCGYKALWAWDLWNEPELTVGIHRLPDKDMLVCYCSHSLVAFRKWLKTQYKDILALNSRWGRNYQSFENVVPPRTGDCFADMEDWRIFFGWTIKEEVEMRKDSIRQIDKNTLVMVHTVPMPYFNFVGTGSHDYLIAQSCDLFGNSVGSSYFAAALSIGAAWDRPVINAEIHAQGGSTMNPPTHTSFQEYKKHILRPLAKGIKGFLFWQYRPESLGLESPAWGLTGLDGSRSPQLEYAVEINKMLQKQGKELIDTLPIRPRVALVTNVKSEIFIWSALGDVGIYQSGIIGAFDLLEDAGYKTAIICEEQFNLQVLKEFECIYLAGQYIITDKEAAVIKEYIWMGGIVIAEGGFASYNMSANRHCQKIPGLGLDEVFGVLEKESSSDKNFIHAYGRGGQGNSKGKDIAIRSSRMGKIYGRYWKQSYELKSACAYASYEDGNIGLTINSFGRGKAILLGSWAGFAYNKNRRKSSPQFINKLLVELKIFPDNDINYGKYFLLEGENTIYIVADSEYCSTMKVVIPSLKGVAIYDMFSGERVGKVGSRFRQKKDCVEIYHVNKEN